MMYKDKFVLSVLHDGSPLREFGPMHDRKVSMPFGSEYSIRLRNKNRKDCTARVYVDGAKLSSFGDIIIQAGSHIDLERFITGSMNNGNKLKFVSLDHPGVNDPHSSDNGTIKVEFRLAKSYDNVILDGSDWQPWYPYVPTQPPYNPYTWRFYTGDSSNDVNYMDTRRSFLSNDAGTKGMRSVNYCASTQPGATVEGGHSDQSFKYGSLSVEETPSAILKLKIVGVAGTSKVENNKKYCTSCGALRRNRDKFCGQCGRRF